MGKNRSASGITNVIQYDNNGNITFVSGSTTLMQVSSSGAITTTGVISGSNALSASFSLNSALLNGTGSVGFATTASLLTVSSSQQQISASQQQLSSSFLTLTASFNAVSSSQQQISASYIALSASYNTFSGSASTRITENSSSIQQVSASQQQISSSQQQISSSLLNVISIFATTGSNSFRANQSITGSLVVSSTITAQTLVVQTVTSSIVYSSGSNIFGCDLNSRQTFTGSIYQTGSLVAFASCVGIGTITPSTLVQAYSTAVATQISVDGTGRYKYFETYASGTRKFRVGWDNTNVQAEVWADANAPILFATNDIEKMRITSGGCIGIGTNNPTYKLEISGSSGTFSFNPNQASFMIIRGSVTGNFDINNEGASGAMRLYGTSIQLRTAATDPALTIASTGAATFACSVNVNGLATSANYKLGVTGAAFISGTNSKGIFITDSATYASIVGLNSAISTYNPLELRGSGCDYQLYLATNGNVGVGCSAPAKNLSVNGCIGMSTTYNWGITNDNDTNWGFRVCSTGGNYSTFLSYAGDAGSDRRGGIYNQNGHWVAYGNCLGHFVVQCNLTVGGSVTATKFNSCNGNISVACNTATLIGSFTGDNGNASMYLIVAAIGGAGTENIAMGILVTISQGGGTARWALQNNGAQVVLTDPGSNGLVYVTQTKSSSAQTVSYSALRIGPA